MKKIAIYQIIIWMMIILFQTILCISFANDNGTTVQQIGDVPILEEGTYAIKSVINNKYGLDVTGPSKANGANIQLFEYLGVNQQKFTIKYLTDGYYTITSCYSDKVLDVAGGEKIPGANIQQYESNGTDAQKWKIQKNTDGTYSMISKCNGLYVDVTASDAKNKTNIQMYTGNGTIAQKFHFIKVNGINGGTRTINDGIYKIHSKLAENRLLEVPSSNVNDAIYIKTAMNNNKANQKFKISYNNDGTYTILALHSGKSLDVPGGSTYNGTLVQQYTSNGTNAQKWIIIKNEDNTYSFISKCNGLALDIACADKSVGANVQMYDYNGTNAQKFEFEVCTTETGTKSSEDGVYRILSKTDRNKVFDVEGASVQNGGVIQLWENVKVIQQKFEIKYVGDGYYKIKAENSNKILTVQSTTPKVGSKIVQQEDQDLDTQKWILKKYTQGVYSIISKCGNLYIDIGSSNIQNGQDLQLRDESDLTTQQFIFVNETPQENVKRVDEGIYQIVSKSNKVLDIINGRYDNQANVQLFSNEKVQQQKFHIYPIENTNYFKIIAVHSAKALDVQNGNSNCGANIQQYESNETGNQYWLLKDCGDGYYNIISKANGLCLDIESGRVNDNGANVQLYYCNGTEAQKFKLMPINIINNNTYEIETKLNNSKVVDIYNGLTQDKANAQLWDADNVKQQRFIFEALSTDTYKIIAKHSSKALTADINSNNVYQTTYTGANYQQWKIKEAGDGYYSLICKENGRALDVEGALANNGQNIQIYSQNNTNAQKFRFIEGFRKFYQEGTYGKSGLTMAGDRRGTDLRYYKYGKGSKVLFTTFSIHGFEDSYNHDGSELTYIAEEFKKYVNNNIEESIINNWTIYIFPNLNPDGQTHGWTNMGPGRNTLYSAAPGNKGIDMNRNFSVGYQQNSGERNYNGTSAFQAYEARALREFMLNHQGSIKTITVDTHGWLNETVGDNELGYYYRNQFGLPTHINAYGSGYLINWARTLTNGRSVLIELPEVSNHSQVINKNYVQKYINATIQMLKEN